MSIIHKSPVPDVQLFYGSWPDLMRTSPHAHNDSKPVVFDFDTKQQLTWKQVWQLSARLRAQLYHKYGIGKPGALAPFHNDPSLGDVVIFYTPNTYSSLPYHLALHDLGATISPASTSYDVKDICHQIVTTDAVVVVAAAEKSEIAREAVQLSGRDVRVVVMEDLINNAPTVAQNDIDSAPHVSLSRDQARAKIAYLGMSSGTSGGLPKAVRLTHFNVTSNCLQVSAAAPNLAQNVVASAVIPTTHIYGLTMFLSVLPYNGSVVIHHKQFNLRDLLEAQKTYKVSLWILVPPVIVQLAKNPMVDEYLDSIRAHVRCIVSGAAPLGGNVVDQVSVRLTGNKEGILPNGDKLVIHQAYGLTESSPIVGMLDPLSDHIDVMTVGCLMPNTEARIVDEEGNDQPAVHVTDTRGIGAAVKRGEKIPSGELWIRGPQIMDGYHKNPESSRESLEPSTETYGLQHFQDRWLRTGDVAVIDTFGRVMVVDRTKELIKSMSRQVAPAELEALLLNHPSVNDVAVVGVHNDDNGTESARAFVVLQPGDACDPTTIKHWMDQQVPSYKRLYGGIVVIDTVPKNASGKILRRLLRQRRDDRVWGLAKVAKL
ncbi:hypothetical protein B0I72DRAFT_172398 [Yarrowia lipolytica]|jgi:4-coumarate--CoA ligase|uniref:YALI0B07755p n=2 Tax=Yarrowia lipolytica TaxID=4952 RepID=Q6CFE4_YARLI|nr:YALI0B07755p [Yarrowia lipolytica CLIB122]AOW01378.1 hypothetical protein YALI1_B10231g [Yarrowia lipolytica]KAB8281808.1 hypothetical protein BKA91DRAFT_174644 [Yarrowia lipolytica]KAE8171579.1 hypothetical protein BKA90DRAFT_174832 [Yarrowia lipolytica]KAJ8052219.1 hypothetical protein LXG23DRAFT_51712 [Yarrowia lipolytica]RDW24553.1 hypothetical protein B0I71DRAFT_175999 [Yarrowia lipolytica]|eukprot:XP_500618.1 YALI0B07755p [Yarrowia lipolytica CLIB122]